MLRPFGELGCTSGCHSGLPGVEEFVPVGVEIQFAGQYRVGLANTAMAGDILVIGSGVFLYASIARWKLSQSRFPLAGVLPASARFTVFTPISARKLLWGLATEQRRW